MIKNTPANTILNRGILITASQPVSIVYEVTSTATCNCDPEIFVLKGQNAFGTNFLVPTQNFFNNSSVDVLGVPYVPPGENGFDIVAIENTNVTITPTRDIIGHPAGIAFSINLLKGQTYSAIATSNLGVNHLAGSSVVSTGKIAITMKDDLMNGGPAGPCDDLGGDQIVPVEVWGTEYIAVNGFLNNITDQVFILGLYDNTKVNINGSPASTINKGQVLQTNIPDSFAVYINSDQPVAVVQASGYSCELGSAILPQLQCTGSYQVPLTRSTTEPFYMTIVCQKGIENGFTVNGNPFIVTASNFQPVATTGGQWLAARIPLSTLILPLNQSIVVRNSLGRFHLGELHGGYYTGCRFGYFSDFNKIKPNAKSNGPVFCQGDTLKLACDSSSFTTSVSWKGANNFASNLKTPVKVLNLLSDSGWYYVQVAEGSCSSMIDSIFVSVKPLPPTNAGPDTAFCAGYNYQLHASGGNTYQWSPSNGLSNPTIANPVFTGNQSQSYILKGTDVNGCFAYDTISLTVRSLPSLSRSPDTTICAGGKAMLSAIISPGNSINWSPVTNLSFTDSVHAIANPSTSTIYYLQTSDKFTCTTKDSIGVRVLPSPVFSVSPASGVCAGSSAQLTAAGGDSYSWTPNSYISNPSISNPLVNPVATTDYTVIITNSACKVGDTLTTNVQVNPAPIIKSAKSNDIECSGTSQLNATGGARYSWQPAALLNNPAIANPVASPYQTTTFMVVGYDANGCSNKDSVTVNVGAGFNANNYLMPTAFTPNNDGLNDCFGIRRWGSVEVERFDIFNR